MSYAEDQNPSRAYNKVWSVKGGRELCLHSYGAMTKRRGKDTLFTMSWNCAKCGSKLFLRKLHNPRYWRNKDGL